MKSIWVVTNNERIAKYRMQGQERTPDKGQEQTPGLEDFRVEAVKGNVRDVVFRARDLLMAGWRLTADPLGGRRERANPYLTVILERDFRERGTDRGERNPCGGLVGSAGLSGPGGEILRVEQLLSIFERNEEQLSQLTERQKSDYAALDASLACGALELLAIM